VADTIRFDVLIETIYRYQYFQYIRASLSHTSRTEKKSRIRQNQHNRLANDHDIEKYTSTKFIKPCYVFVEDVELSTARNAMGPII